MTERDVQGSGMALLGLIAKHIADDCPPQQQAEAQAFVNAGGVLVVQALVDLNRIANALEQIALNGHPRAL